MLNKIAIGKYVYGTSILHNGNPVMKLICSLLYIVSLFFLPNWYCMVIFCFFLILLLFFSKISYKTYFQLLWQMRYFLCFLILFNWIFGVFLSRNLLIILQLICALLYSSMILYTTPISDLIYAIMVLLSPLTFLHIPVPMISYVIGLSLSFLTNMLGYANQILKSLCARGMDYMHSHFREKIRIWKLILIPLFTRSIKYADEVADTMEVRLYDMAQKKVIFRNLKISRCDIVLLLSHIFLVILVVKEGVLCVI